MVVVSIGLLVAACGDDGNDDRLPARHAAESPAVEAQPSATAAPTLPLVEPSGVVVSVVALDNTFRPAQLDIEVERCIHRDLVCGVSG